MISPAFLLCHNSQEKCSCRACWQLFRISLYYQRRDLVQHPLVKNVLSHTWKDFARKKRIHPIKE
ncbi:hypothetical protein MITSMUL_04975 [Mitsuokella multacida DSM 20544]|uniref:Uncharacterized protein n=1 Tax=Mitsuokella multacida DSM 20544 TaxID=500635 RepID=C9KP20_9FIRM|nr:hypothetical protein MITSMUL_04975 [Mitsuokella multacida DSM 20544]